MKLTSFLLPLSLLCLTLAQQPGDHTVPTTTPTLSVLACSDRDSSTSALESCTKYHTPGLEYTPECTDLFWLQGLFSTCTIAVTVTKTSGMVTSTITKGPSPTIIRSTKRIRRTITAFSVMPKEDDTTTVTEYVTAATMNMNDQTKDVLGPAVPEYLPRWPREECLGMSKVGQMSRLWLMWRRS